MDECFSIESYDYDLPEHLIAQQPAERRDASRLMVLHRKRGKLSHRKFGQVAEFLRPGDCLVMNNSRVFPARLLGRRETGGRVEFFLLHYPSVKDGTPGVAHCTALTRSSKRLHSKESITVSESLRIEFLHRREDGSAEIRLHYPGGLQAALESAGQTPLPPYIRRKNPDPEDRNRYQTVYAREIGSVAAPTAGLHFTEEILEELKEKGVRLAQVTLHVGYGTFAPLRAEDIREHKIHSEYVTVPEETCQAIEESRADGGRIVAVGTTTVRSLEWCAGPGGKVEPRRGECDLYIMPGFRFRAVDAMITNFHLPRSSLLVLVSAFAGRDAIMHAYATAVAEGYRFYSYGDAMLIV